MRKFISIVLLVGSFCAIAKADEFVRSIVTDGMSEIYRRGGMQVLDPKYAYSLFGAVVFQKFKNGYLLVNGGPGGSEEGDETNPMNPVFLYTDEDLQQNYIFRELEMAHYVGEYEYQTVTGFRKKIHAFKLFRPQFVQD